MPARSACLLLGSVFRQATVSYCKPAALATVANKPIL